jgi:hypothetical protein
MVSKVIAMHLYNYLFMKELGLIPVFRSDDTHTPSTGSLKFRKWEIDGANGELSVPLKEF